MGMSSNKSSSTGTVVSCVVLGLALLVVGAAGAARSSPNSCKALCAGREDYKPCRDACLWGVRLGAHGSKEGEKEVGGVGEEVNCHLRCRHAKVYDTCFKQCKSDIGGVAARVEGVGLLLATPAEGQKQEEDKMKKLDTGLHLPGWLCEEEFGTSSDSYIQCCRECYPPNRQPQCCAPGGRRRSKGRRKWRIWFPGDGGGAGRTGRREEESRRRRGPPELRSSRLLLRPLLQQEGPGIPQMLPTMHAATPSGNGAEARNRRMRSLAPRNTGD